MYLLFSSPRVITWILLVGLGIIAFFALRKFLIWYAGMIELISESRKQTKLLEEIRDEIKNKKSLP